MALARRRETAFLPLRAEGTRKHEAIESICSLTWSGLGRLCKLPVQRSADSEAFFRAIHQLQQLMAIRTARRDHPGFWKDDGDA
jgi:hypothetical protein